MEVKDFKAATKLKAVLRKSLNNADTDLLFKIANGGYRLSLPITSSRDTLLDKIVDCYFDSAPVPKETRVGVHGQETTGRDLSYLAS